MNRIHNPKEKFLFIFGVLLYSVVMYALKLPCIFKYLFHIPCPGCGMIRAALSLIRLDFASAFFYHPLFPLVPFVFLFFIFDGRVFKKSVDRVLMIGIALAFLVVWILRLTGVIPAV